MSIHFEYSPDVQQAIENKQPILALESTLISHGLPYPENLNTALEVEEMVRREGTTPATIAILEGKIKIGLSTKELEYLATYQTVNKVSVRDIPFILSQSLNGATTVAATIFIAAQAGISLMATGGIGGVHRGNELDISADLIELARTKIAVICAGAKSILDLPRTLEFLETYSIPIIGYKTNVFPAFYTALTPYPLATRINTMRELGKFLHHYSELPLSSGVVIAQPIPTEYEIPSDIIEPAIDRALKQASMQKISGKAVTPFLLKELTAITNGKTLAANVALIKNNALLGAQLAKELHKTSQPGQRFKMVDDVLRREDNQVL